MFPGQKTNNFITYYQSPIMLYKKPPLLLIICLIGWLPVFSQDNYREGYEKADPIPVNAQLELRERVKIHQEFLKQAIQQNDSLHQLYAFLYLFTDYGKAGDYVEADRYLLKADAFAKSSGKTNWQGWVSHRKGILFLRLKKYEESIKHYKIAAQLCGEAGDSLCLAESLEQIGAIYGQIQDFEASEYYYSQALPLIEKYGNEFQQSTVFNNYAIRLFYQGKPAEAIPFYRRSIAIYRKQSRHKEEAQALNNLATAYKNLNLLSLAIETYDSCLLLNKKLNFPDNLITNYLGLHELYKEKQDFQIANDFLIKYYTLRDSLIGAQTQEKIADLEIKYESREKELALQKSQTDHLLTQNKLERRTLLLLLIIVLIAFGIWRWRFLTRQAKQEIKKNQENLTRVTSLLIKKNKRLLDLEKTVNDQTKYGNPDREENATDKNLLSLRILTNDDWNDFKIFFEKSFPGYLMHLRTHFNNLSEAEERLFLFIKLNLKRKEAAAILGISSDSVKKTRHRLRKRLELEKDVDLEEYIRSF